MDARSVTDQRDDTQAAATCPPQRGTGRGKPEHRAFAAGAAIQLFLYNNRISC